MDQSGEEVTALDMGGSGGGFVTDTLLDMDLQSHTPRADRGDMRGGVEDCSLDCELDAEATETLDRGVIPELDADPPPVCQPRVDARCFDNDVYWVDSCGARGELNVECDDHEVCIDDPRPGCVCLPNVRSACSEGNRYWYNACDERGEVRETCSGESVCYEDACLPRISGSGTCQDPLRILGGASASVNSCDSDDTLSFCGSQGVREVAILVETESQCGVQISSPSASFHVTSGRCEESSSCIGGVENFGRDVPSGRALFIIEPESCGDVNIEVSCQ